MADPKALPEIADLLQEDRRFAPSATFREQATINDEDVYARADRDPEAFWAGFAKELEWFSPWSRILEWNPPHAKWFSGGTLGRDTARGFVDSFVPENGWGELLEGLDC